MFLPVTIDSAERIVETIQEIKEKIPSDPFEAELILMAEMVAEQDEKNNKEERMKGKVVEKNQEKRDAPAPDGKNVQERWSRVKMRVEFEALIHFATWHHFKGR